MAYADRFELEQEIVRRRDEEEEDGWDDTLAGEENASGSGGQVHAVAPQMKEHRVPVRRPPLRTD